jgi:hypothetical protein
MKTRKKPDYKWLCGHFWRLNGKYTKRELTNWKITSTIKASRASFYLFVLPRGKTLRVRFPHKENSSIFIYITVLLIVSLTRLHFISSYLVFKQHPEMSPERAQPFFPSLSNFLYAAVQSVCAVNSVRHKKQLL